MVVLQFTIALGVIVDIQIQFRTLSKFWIVHVHAIDLVYHMIWKIKQNHVQQVKMSIILLLINFKHLNMVQIEIRFSWMKLFSCLNQGYFWHLKESIFILTKKSGHPGIIYSPRSRRGIEFNRRTTVSNVQTGSVWI